MACVKQTGTWTKEETKILDGLKDPAAIQAFLDSTQYSSDHFYRSPRAVLRDRKAHCADGALFAAAALERLGLPATIMELRAVRDDDHLLAVFRRDGFFGAIAKSNFAGLRFREPIFRNLRELALSYFEDYFNLDREKTLRGYSVVLDLAAFNHLDWRVCDEKLEQIMEALDKVRHYPLLSKAQVEALSPVDDRRFNAGTLGLNFDGVYKPQ
jgi:hypothetical protein